MVKNRKGETMGIIPEMNKATPHKPFEAQADKPPNRLPQGKRERKMPFANIRALSESDRRGCSAFWAKSPSLTPA